jgi:hypothetical protein
MEEMERRERGSEFQIVGAETEKDRWPMVDLTRGRERRNWEEERRLQVGACR